MPSTTAPTPPSPRPSGLALADLPAGLRLQPGRLVLEVLPAGAGKDAAVAALAERFHPGSVLVLGDDLTDVAMFEAAHSSSGETGVHVLALAVEGGAETPPEVVAASDVVVAQGQVGQLLALIAAELAGPPQP